MRRGPYWPHLYIVKEDGEPALRLWALSCLIQDRSDVLPSYQQFISQLKDKVRVTDARSVIHTDVVCNRSTVATTKHARCGHYKLFYETYRTVPRTGMICMLSIIFLRYPRGGCR